MLGYIVEALMKSIDWSSRTEQQYETAFLADVKVSLLLPSSIVMHSCLKGVFPILSAFVDGPRTEVSLLNNFQAACHEDVRILKTFQPIVKSLYAGDVVSDQAIIYWHTKGAIPAGKQNFLNATAALVKVSLFFYIFISTLMFSSSSFKSKNLPTKKTMNDKKSCIAFELLLPDI